MFWRLESPRTWCKISHRSHLRDGVMSCGAKPSTDAGVGSVLYKKIIMEGPGS